MTSFRELLALTARLFLPLAVVLAALGYLLADLPPGFATAAAALTAFAAQLTVAATSDRRPHRGRGGRRRLNFT